MKVVKVVDKDSRTRLTEVDFIVNFEHIPQIPLV